MVIVLGVVVAVVAVIALHEPNGHHRAASSTGSTASPGTQSKTSTSSASRTASDSPTPSGGSGSSSRVTSSAASTTATDPKSVPLVVLNDTTTSKLAAGAAARFRSGGWTVTSSGNLPGDISDIISTCAYYDPDSAGAKAAADALQAQYPTIKRVVPRFSDLPAGPVVVVLAPDYSAD